MRIENVNAMNMGMKTGMSGQGTDATSKNIQNQIQNKQQELQKLSENEEMSMEEKMKKRQSIQQEIADLNMQLRQHQIEQRKEQRQSKGSSMDDMLGGKQRVSSKSKKGQNAGMSQATMTAIISADSSMKQAQVQGNVAEQNEGRAGVLKAEIKQDAALGGDTRKKEEELAKVEQKAADATAAQLNTLGEANKTMEEAAEAERENSKTDSSKAESSKTKNKKEAADRKDDVSGNEQDGEVQGIEEAQDTGLLGKAEDVIATETAEVSVESNSGTVPNNLPHVDVRL